MRFKNNTYYIAVFSSRNHAIQLYQHLLLKKHTDFELVPTPCRVTSGCSYSIKFIDSNDYEILLKEANLLNMKIEAIYTVERKNGNRVLKKW